MFIVLLSDGIIGDNCVDTLRSIATGVNAAIDRNHALPMLQEIYCDNLVFGVFPLVGSYFAPAWFSNIAQVLEAMSQVMEVRLPIIKYANRKAYHLHTGCRISA